MTARLRLPLVALLAALAALLAPLGATAAGSVAVAGRQAAPGAAQATGLAPAGRVTPGRELRDTEARRVLPGGAEVAAVVTAASGQAGQGGPAHVPADAAAVVLLAVAVGWWVRRSQVDRALVGRTSGSRCGRGPPALACA